MQDVSSLPSAALLCALLAVDAFAVCLVSEPSGLAVRCSRGEGSSVSVSTGRMQRHSSGFGCVSPLRGKRC